VDVYDNCTASNTSENAKSDIQTILDINNDTSDTNNVGSKRTKAQKLGSVLC
jgi:uncharacterized protein YfcZ (UPF0381/DUF406 family)